ncbi:YkgJ family cysteine cluster protein [Cytobacillus sp.]|uniref:YkgJ family cysteine cluster protein n=1 Tax=Cytobacillus sp. TaxID=2675269 RepID=UPI0028BF089A|nr:YkgJ family cysteine cluster protein [Cytobacillus sp.]
MVELDNLIQQLRTKDPYWNKCHPCKNKGKCCIGANPSFSDKEWQDVIEYLDEIPKDDYDKLLENFKHNKLCPFRTESKCLIHKVRPFNCKYTPFQAVYRNDGKIIYSMTTDDCNFKTVVSEPNMNFNSTENFIELNNFLEKRSYLLINNWVISNNLLEEPEKKATELLNSYFAK